MTSRRNLRKDEAIDQESYRHKIKAQKHGAKADSFRYEAYSTRSEVNGLFAKALKLKEKAYQLESVTEDSKSRNWKQVYRLKKEAFFLETEANIQNSKYYRLKKLFYCYAEKEALEHAEFTRLKSENYKVKIETNAPGECGSKDKQ